jgi:hypothetical protein
MNCQDLNLETRCSKCQGSGRNGRCSKRCVLCGGSGYKPTEFGEKVLALLRHNFRPLFSELMVCVRRITWLPGQG